MELIIPETEIPGAINLKLPEFLDGYISAVFSEQGQKKWSIGLDHFIAVSLFDSEKSNANKLTNEDLDFQLAKYLKADFNNKKFLEKGNSRLSKSFKK